MLVTVHRGKPHQTTVLFSFAPNTRRLFFSLVFSFLFVKFLPASH
jgi:hypothetical protein